MLLQKYAREWMREGLIYSSQAELSAQSGRPLTYLSSVAVVSLLLSQQERPCSNELSMHPPTWKENNDIATHAGGLERHLDRTLCGSSILVDVSLDVASCCNVRPWRSRALDASTSR